MGMVTFVRVWAGSIDHLGGPMIVHYLEIVTPDVDTTCEACSQIHGVTFGAPEPMLGGARTAPLSDGGRVGVRAPMAEHEAPVVRTYLRVEDIEAAVVAVEAAGATIAHPPLELPGLGRFAIYIQGGLQHGLWQV
jgi:predicted enzyme related to lactoylglutathione lyase